MSLLNLTVRTISIVIALDRERNQENPISFIDQNRMFTIKSCLIRRRGIKPSVFLIETSYRGRLFSERIVKILYRYLALHLPFTPENVLSWRNFSFQNIFGFPIHVSEVSSIDKNNREYQTARLFCIREV